MPHKEMKLPKEYGMSCAPAVNADGAVVRPGYVKSAGYYCTKCGHVQAPSHSDGSGAGAGGADLTRA